MGRQIEVAGLVSRMLTPFSVAAIISVAFSWFSPTGTGRVIGPPMSMLIGFLTLSIGPFLPVVYNAKRGRSDLDVSDISKRIPLYGLGLASYGVGVVIFFVLNDRLMFVMALAYLCVGSTMLAITLVWKISAHTAGIAGPTTALAFVFGASILPLYALSILMVWARVKLGAHTLAQAVGGLVVALTVTSLVYCAFYL
jgi:membrane-associated phospholipid phosphatase